ncbi:MAG: flagellin [Steroidobacteraceae bacterium]
MSLTINTNTMSLNAQRNLTTSQASLATSLQRLSSGLRINSAKDDAAGMAISSRMTTQISGLTVAQRNANDAISLAQTAEGALQEVTNNLQRIRELAVQAANASNSDSDRAALNEEVQQRLTVLEKIASQTSFNGQKVLDGTFGNATFQIGANVGDTMSLNLSTSMKTTDIGKIADWVGGSAYDSSLAVGQQGTGASDTALTSGGMTIALGNGDAVSIGASVAGATTYDSVDGSSTDVGGQTASSAYAKAEAINAAGIEGLTATADTTAKIGWSDVASGSAYTLSINGTAVYSATADAVTGDDAVKAINAVSDETGVTATYDGTDITLHAEDGSDIYLEQSGTGGLGTAEDDTVNNSENADVDFSGGGTVRGSVRLISSDTITVAGTSATDAGFDDQSYSLGTDAIAKATVSTVEDANTTIAQVDAALTQVNSLRSALGAIQSSFESMVSSMSTTSENLSAARSRIQDADFASETANLSRAQILQQAGTAILAQANSIQQNVLKLLQ